MRRPYLMEALLVLIIWALLLAFVLYDTPIIAEAAKVTPSPYYWRWLDDTAPREDTMHPQG